MSEKIDNFLASLTKTASAEDAGMEKQAQEALMEKYANQNETVEAATNLNLASTYLVKVASLEGLAPEMKDLFTECSSTLSDCSADMMLGLQKIAAEDIAGMVTDMIDSQQNMYKVATVLNACADGCEDQEFVKMASVVTDINNRLYDEIVELASKDPSVDNYLKTHFGSEE